MAIIKLHNPVLAENSTFGNFVVESLAADPTLTGILSSGRIWFNSTEKRLKGAFLDEAGTSVDLKYLADAGDVTTINTSITNLGSSLSSDISTLSSDVYAAIASLSTSLNSDIGELENLTTTVKTTIVDSINELDALQGNVALTTTATTITGAIVELDAEIGNLSSLTTTATTVVGAINELDALQGNVVLTTTATTITGAIVELDAEIGNLSSLTTTATTVVGAINELDALQGNDTLTTTATTLTSAINELDSVKVEKINITGATVGSASQIPVITYNDQGQITSSTYASIQIDLQGVTDLGNTTTNSITMTDGDTGTTAGLTADFLTTANATTTGTLEVETDATVGGTLSVDGATTIGVDGTPTTLTLFGDGTVTGNIVVQGNLTVSGTETIVETEILKVADNIITLNNNIGAVDPTENAGLEVDRGNYGVLTFLQFNEVTDTVQIAVGSVDTYTMIDVATSTDVSNLQTELDATQTSLGFSDTTYTATSLNYIAGSTVTADISKLDTELKRVEDGVGVWGNLTTTSKVVVGAVNELDSEVGTLSGLTTTVKTTIVGAINELDALQGNVALTTTAQTITGAIVELDAEIGTISGLTTDVKSTVVGAINEVDLHANNIYDAIGSFVTEDAAVLVISGTNYLNADTTVSAALTTLDSTLKTRADAINTAAGISSDTYSTSETSNYLKATDFTTATLDANLFNADLLLDAKIKSIADNTDGNIGDLGTLTTDATDTLVNAINEVDLHANNIYDAIGSYVTEDATAIVITGTNYLNAETTVSLSLGKLDTELKRVENGVGVWGNLTTTSKVVVGAINELDAEIGTISGLTTDVKSTVVGAINEVDLHANNLYDAIGSFVTEDAAVIAISGSNYMDAATTVSLALTALDTTLKTRADAINTAAGITEDTYTANGEANFISTATSLVSSDNLLDAALKTTIDNLASTTLTEGSGLVGFAGYTEDDVNIVDPTIEITAGTVEAALIDICESVNLKIHEMENRYVKGEVSDGDKSDVYTIAHNLDTSFVDVAVQVYDTDEEVWRFDLVVVEVVDSNTVKISLAGGVAAQVRYVIQGY